MTRKEVELLLRKKHGDAAGLEERKAAMTPEQRAESLARYREMAAEKEAADEGARALGDVHGALLAAARFAVDVDGDEPSWTQLREALERAEKKRDLKARAAELYERIRQESGRRMSYRWRAVKPYTIPGVGTGLMELAAADTLEALAEKLKNGR